MSRVTSNRNSASSTSSHGLVIATLAALLLPASMAAADEIDDLIAALTGGKPTFNLRSRMEIADTTNASEAQAYTARLRLGYGTAPYHGFSVYADMEHISAVSERTYRGNNRLPANGETIIADPEDTQLNQAYLKFQSDDWGFAAIGGRQRITLDDHRFVGNVGWRQNEQTYDAATLKGSFGVEDFEFFYSYVWEVKRIFGDQGNNPLTRDFDSNSHFINASYSGLPCGKVTVFAYLLDFNNTAVAKANSNNTFGLRFTGNRDLSDDLNLGYQSSYAYQADGDDNPANYDAHYVLADLNLGYKPAGRLGFGFELQSRDHGKGSFITPLATLHRWNGFADGFLTSNTPMGLRDYYAYVAPKLPFELKGKFIYHHFESDRGGRDLGNEYDVVLSRSFLEKRLTVLSKIAYLDGSNATPDLKRYWLEATIAF